MSDNLAKRLEGLSPEKLALLSKRLQKKDSLKRQDIARRSHGDSHPLSLAQQRLWFINQLQPGNAFYNMAGAMRLTGVLNVEALEETLNEITRRHEVLRTHFPISNGKPIQVVSPARGVSIPTTDLSDLPLPERERAAGQLVKEESEQPFALEHGPLHRTRLVRLANDEHLLIITMHHIVADGWSIGVFLREMAALYEAFSQNRLSPLPELEIQYGDYARWQKQWLTDEVLYKQLSYWQNQLSGSSATIDLPLDYERPNTSTHRAATQSFKLSAGILDALEELSREQDVTLFTTLLASFYVLLHRYSGQEDINLGSPVMGRSLVQTEELIGFFVNSLVLRGDLSGNPSFTEFLQTVREMVLDAQSNQEVPFEKIVEALQPERSLVTAPLFQAVFRMENLPDEVEFDLSGLTITPVSVPNNTTEYDLIFSTTIDRDGLIANAIYSADLFKAGTIDQLLSDFEELLERIIAEPEKPIADLSGRFEKPAESNLLTAAERQKVLVEWNDTRAPISTDLCFHEIFEAQVERTPDQTAVVFETEEVSYRELNSRANKLAQYLQTLGVGPDVRVALCVERSVRMLVGLLGILKAGGAYLPLDPSYPLDRLSFMLDDGQAPILLTESKLLDAIPVGAAQVICLDDDWDIIAAESGENVSSGADLHNLAYVIYTSGSTGKPKGVMIEHCGLINLAEAQVKAFAEPPAGRVLQLASLSFDASIFEIVMALRAGATICLGTRESLMPGQPLLELLRDRKITNLTIPPSILTSLPSDELPELKTIIVAGEACAAENVARWSKGRNFFNAYGPTETTVWASTAHCVDGTQKPTIGHPILNTKIFLLDEQQAPVAIGSAGELFIGGAGVARGYLNRPELTAERFVPDPFSGDSGARLYRTGDLARYLPDGRIEFLGRIDHQVKLRGLRIELGEIESVLTDHPQLTMSAVVLQDRDTADARIVAYIVPREDAPTNSQLRDYLKDKLPEYMIPSVFVTLAEMPLTPNGKVDHRSLPSVNAAEVESETVFVAPRTRTEEILAGSWSQVLNVEQIGIDDNFFALGGDSIRSVQVLSKAKERGLEVTLQQLFKYQTIRKLAEHLNTSPNVAEVAPRTEPFAMISEADRRRMSDTVEDAYPLTSMQAGMLFQSDLQKDAALYHAVNSLHLKVPFNQSALQSALQQLAELNTVMRTSFDLVNFSEPLQLVHRDVQIPIEVDDIRSLSDEEQKQFINEWIQVDKHRRLDLNNAPLLRFHIHRRTEESVQFTFTAHHSIFDGWSDAVFLTELLKLYLAIVNEETVEAAETLAISFRDYVVLERQASNSKESQSFWSDWLSDFELSKPSRLVPAPDEDAPRFDSTQIRLDTELSEKLNRLARAAAVPLKTVLLAAHLHVMSALDGQSDVLTGLVSNGRPDTTGGERIIGLFLNTLPFRAQLNGGTWEDLIGATFAAELETLPHRRYPLAQIQLDAGGQTLFDTCFNYTHFHLYDSLADVNELEVLGSGGVAETEFAVMANFNVDLSHDYIELLLICDSFQLPITQIKYLRDYYVATLSAMVADQLARYEEHSPLTQAEIDRLLTDWNQTAVDYPRDKTVHELFEAQVQRTPSAVAVVLDDEELTYADLNVRANQLANYLRTIDVKPDSRVGICLERSLEMVVAVLGVLKAGAAYVPLDPNYPADRLMLILEQSSVEVLLTHTTLASRLPSLELSTVYLDSAREEISRQSEESPKQLSGPDNLAYVIYTSGSTGTPKGVAMTHRPLVNLVSWEVRRIGAPLRSSQFASLSFDVSFQEIFTTLCSGGTLVLIPEEKRRDAKQLLELVIDQQIERLCVPFVALNYLATAAEAEGRWPTHLRQVMSAGEQLKITRPVRRLFKNLPGCTLDNQCGPSETHAVAGFLLPSSVADWTALPPIGRPLSNVRLYVLDKHMRPVPAGVPGTLYIAGDCLSRGYLDRPDLTAERYVPNPFSEHGERLYRSGDIVRYLPAGDVEWLRREDDQVKIRGFRVELGEVETVLTHHTSVREALVIVREDAPGERDLVAYVVPESSISTAALREYLQQRLPNYMVPSAFVLLPSLPLTPSGKLNRRALPAPETVDSSIESTALQAPRTTLEELLSSIWADTLRMREVDVTKNFFDMGGHSLSAIQLISRVREALKVEVELQKLFDRPTVRAMAEEVERMLRLGAGVQTGPIQRTTRGDTAPLSFAQQRLWFIDQLESTGSSMNVPVTLRFTGELDVSALRQTMNELVRRHEVLRTTFRLEAGGEPVQVIHPVSLTTLEVEDLTGIPESEREQEAQRLVREEGRQPFDLSRGPLLRVRLLKLNHNEYIFLSTMHHIVSDGWSMSLLIREMAALYEAFAAGNPSPLPEPQIQYADFAVWQREHLQGPALENHLSYWRKQLAGAPAVLELPTDYLRPAIQTYRGAAHTLAISESTLQSLKQISRENGVTLFMTVLAAWQTVLSKYSGQKDILVGSPIANRNRAETESTIGFFVNTVVLRTDLSGDLTFRDLLSRVREVTLGAYAHEDMPFEKLVEELQPERSLSQAPLFQVLFTFQNTSQETLDMPRVKVSSSELDHETAKFDLNLGAIELNNELTCTLEYRTDLFEASTIERMLRHFRVLLTSVAANPEQRLSEIGLLSGADRKQLLEDFNDTVTELPTDISLTELFERQVENTPETVAVVFEGRQLTYRELNEQANRLGHRLLRLGVAREALVGVMMERSLEMVVALLGIIKAGAAYVPLDPEYPATRLSYMMQDARLQVLLTQSHLLENLPAERPPVVIALDSESLTAESSENLEVRSGGDQLVYCIYTSGSTGQPKGAMNTHRGICNRLLWGQETYGLSTADRVLQKTSFSFDISVWEFFWPLFTGARLVMARPGAQRDSAELVRLVQQQQITTIHFVPSMLQVFLEADGVEDCSSLRRVICSGEALSYELQQRFYERLATVELHNLYGPTEAAVEVSWWACDRDSKTGVVPIGQPVANTQLYVLDEQMQTVALGVRGELYIGGVQLARGYWQRPELTAERFVPHPFSVGGERLYRTGDVASWQADGNIRYLGRVDHQVKLRGFRIELGEIETALMGHELVASAAVVVREDALVAYVVAAQADHAPTAAELRDYLKQRLPHYMVPSAFVLLERLPLSANGKLDKRLLPVPDNNEAVTESFALPRDIVELQLVSIWREVLNLHSVGTRDNFFDLGGHSLLAVRLLARLRQQFNVELPLAVFFTDQPTIETIATHIRRYLVDGSRNGFSPLVAIQPEGTAPKFFCVHPSGGNVMCYAQLSKHLGSNQPFYGLQAHVHSPLSTVKEMAASYIDSLRSVQPVGPYSIGGWSMGGMVAFEMAQQLRAQGEEVVLLALIDTMSPITDPGAVEIDEASLLTSFAFDMGISTDALSISREQLAGLNPLEQLTHVFEIAREQDLIPTDIELAQVERLYTLFKTNFRAMLNYKAQPFDGPITLFTAQETETDLLSGWESFASAVTQVSIPGNHFSLIREPHVQSLAASLNVSLANATENAAA